MAHSNTPTPRPFRVFLASPGDTQPVREIAAQVVDALNTDPLLARRARIELLRWDDPQQPPPFSFLRTPQCDVSTYVGDPAQCDLVIGIYRHRFGTPLPEADFGLSPDGDAWTGSEWEIHRGIEAARAGQVRDVLVFRDTTGFAIPERQPPLTWPEQKHCWEQYELVTTFFKACEESTTAAILRSVNEYAGEGAFADAFDRRLRAWLQAQLDAAQPALPVATAAPPAQEPLTAEQARLLDILLHHGDTPLDKALLSAVYAAPVRGLRGYLLQRFAAWTRPEHGELELRFVNLHLLVDRGAGHDGKRMETRGEYQDLGTLLDDPELAGTDAWVLVGDPGGGKSTLLQHHEMTRARAALRVLAQQGNSGDPAQTEPIELCIWQRLADFRPGDVEPADWLAQRWAAQYPALPPLAELAQRFRLRWLLDGLNEMPAADAAELRQRIRPWSQWIGHRAPPGSAGLHPAAPLFSVRTLEYSQPLGGEGLKVEQVRVAHWTAEQMRRYVELRLGPGHPLWPKIAGDPNLLKLCALPFNLQAQCELAESLGRPARDRAELFSGLAWLRLQRAHTRAELEAPGLLGELDRRQLTDRHWWRQHLTNLPEEGHLLPTLARQAEAMHRSGNGREVSLPQREVAPWLSDPAQRHDWLQAVQRLNLAEVELSGQFRCSHQLWQEYFTARHLSGQHDLPADPALWPPLAQPALDDSWAQCVAALGVKDPLPPPGLNPWEMAVQTAVQLSPQPQRWIAALLGPGPHESAGPQWNLPLAGRAARLVQPRLEADAPGRALLQRLRQALLARSRDTAVDLRWRIEAAEALGELGDPRYEEGRSVDGVRYLLPTAANWVTIPAGAYRIGSEAGGYDDERPVTEVRLEAFQMAFAPVTNAEYRCFIEAGGYEDERWWEGETDRRWRSEGLRNQELIEYWRPRLQALTKDFDKAVQDYFSANTLSYIEGTLRKYQHWSAEEIEGALERSFAARRADKPSLWNDPSFNRPLQPVVGVSWFEARAYTRWLAAVSGRPLRLPTEAEWEAAARGPAARRWPWGDEDPAAGRINNDDAHLRRTSPVGVFPQADSPTGLTDLAGNVWEWALSAFTDRLEAAALTGTASDDADTRRVLRGGAWLGPTDYCRAGSRLRGPPDDRDGSLGFRVVCCPILGP